MKNYTVKYVSTYDLEGELNAFDEQGYVIRDIFSVELPPVTHRFIIVAQRFTVTTEARPAKTEPIATKALKKPKAK